MIALEWSSTGPDLARTALGALAEDPGLRTAILLSLFLDARAKPDDALPDPASTDRRGWLGDALAAVPGDRIGSRLWLLRREKQLAGVPVRAEIYAREALAWIVAEGLAERVDVAAAWQGPGVLGLAVAVPEWNFNETFAVRF